MAREILLAGATGRVGRQVARALASRPDCCVRALVRDPARAADLLPAGVRLVAGDLTRPETLPPAVAGVEAVLIVSPVDPRQCELQGALARACADAGGPLVVKVSGLATALDSDVDSGRWHAQTEREIDALGLPHVFLRPLFFMQNLGFAVAAARARGRVPSALGDAGIGMVDVRDVADVAARLLAGEVDRGGQALTLTGARACAYDEVAALLAAALDREVRVLHQTDAEAQRMLEATGQPDWHVRILLQFNRAFARGDGAIVSPAVAEILGRPPRTLEAWIRETVAAG